MIMIRTLDRCSRDEISALAYAIAAARADVAGAEPWDRAGIVSVLDSLATREAVPVPVIVAAAYAAAADPANQAPIAISWAKYLTPASTRPTAGYPDRRPTCEVCNRPEHTCRAVQAKHRDAGVPDLHDFAPRRTT